MALRWEDETRTLTLGVHDLLDLGERSVDRELAMSSRARALAGQDTHRRVRDARAGDDPDYTAEVALQWTRVIRGWTCTVRGRVDGLWREGDHTVVEEVKSTALDADGLDGLSDVPRWRAQLSLYVFLAAEARHPSPVGRLLLVSLVDGSQRVLHVPLDPGLGPRLDARLDRLCAEREERRYWLARRRDAPVHFPFDAERPGQAGVRREVEAAVDEGRQLLLTAPTGFGKTAAVMTAVLAAAARRGWGVYWATARGTQQHLAAATARAIAARGTPLRTVTLRPRAEVCLNGVVDCRAEACRHADGYRDRLDAPTFDALAALATPDPAAVRALGEHATLCPYELALDWAPRCDLVIGDYNYLFDPGVHVRRLLGEEPRVVVVDEVHQLVDRAVGYGSPALPLALADAVLARADAPAWAAIRALAAAIRDAIEEAGLRALEGLPDAAVVELPAREWADWADRVDELALDHARLRVAAPLAAPGEPDPWTELARGVFRFAEALGRAGEETVALWSPTGLRLVCRDPAPILRPRLAEAPAVVGVSATLRPDWFWAERLGLDPARLRRVEAPSPFPPEHRRVLAVPGVSTAFRHRERDRARIATIIGRTVAAVPGNVAVYVGSFEELRAYAVAVDWGDRALLVQSPEADEGERAQVLAAMAAPGPPRVLLAVLGGVYAEGVDLPGDALRAVVVVGPAIPPPTVERALQARWFDERYDEGFDLAYVLPGMVRVVQAAGRVVRTPEDRGVVVLLCQRFLRHEHARLLPEDWPVTKSSRPWEEVARFFVASE